MVSRGHVCQRLKAFPTVRATYIRIEGRCTTKLEVTRGVPQQSVLGPLIFLFDINGLSLKSLSFFFTIFIKVVWLTGGENFSSGTEFPKQWIHK